MSVEDWVLVAVTAIGAPMMLGMAFVQIRESIRETKRCWRKARRLE